MAGLLPSVSNHAHILLRRLIAQNPNTGPAHHYLYVVGESTQVRHNTDRELPFRQESNFAWISGCEVPGSAMVISCEYAGGELDPSTVSTKLYLPEVDADEVMWCGVPPSPSFLSRTLHHTSITNGWTPVSLFPPTPSNKDLKTIIHTLPWTLSPKQIVSTINGPTHTSRYLLRAFEEARRNKDAQEAAYMRKVNKITSEAHEELMRAVGSGSVKDENEAEAIFVAYCRKFGAKQQAYTPIVAAGPSAGTLHYIANDLSFPTEGPGSLLLVDAGGEYKNYASDVTRCIPIGNGGKFTKECKEIYELVLSMQMAAFDLIRPGASYEEIQYLMHVAVARGLLKLGIFMPASISGASEGEVVQKLMSEGLTSAFYPHGVGHLLGLDVHDVGGLPEGKSKDPLLKYLRLRVPLEVGFVVTVEPGIYFNEHLFQAHKNSEFVDHEVLSKYWYVGGVRIEDNLLITEDGFENLTSAAKTVAEVEAITTSGRRN